MAVTADKRPLGAFGRMGVVAAMHVAVLLVLARSFGVMPTATGPERIDVVPVEPRPFIDERPPMPNWKPDNVDILVPKPDVVPIDDDPPDGGVTAKVLPDDGTKAGGGSAQVVPDDVFGVRADPKHPLTQPPYPPSLIRANQEGSVDLEIYVLPTGRIGDARVLRSSGFEDFDRSALQEARRNWRMLPASKGGEAFAQWYRLRVVFKLQNAR